MRKLTLLFLSCLSQFKQWLVWSMLFRNPLSQIIALSLSIMNDLLVVIVRSSELFSDKDSLSICFRPRLLNSLYNSDQILLFYLHGVPLGSHAIKILLPWISVSPRFSIRCLSLWYLKLFAGFDSSVSSKMSLSCLDRPGCLERTPK